MLLSFHFIRILLNFSYFFDESFTDKTQVMKNEKAFGYSGMAPGVFFVYPFLGNIEEEEVWEMSYIF